MNILETILNSQNGAAVQQISQSLGIGQSDAQNALGKLLPAVARGLSNNASSQDGLSALLGALNKGNHQQYLDNPASVGDQASIDDGNGILGHIFGSKDVSRDVASRAAEQTGLSAGILKKMLPMVATLAMGALGKQASGSGLLGSALSGGAMQSELGGLASFLDFDKDGSIADDLLGIARKLF